MAIQKIKITECPFCGGTEFVKGAESGRNVYVPDSSALGRQVIWHQICRNCGTLIREYVQAPEKLKEY